MSPNEGTHDKTAGHQKFSHDLQIEERLRSHFQHFQVDPIELLAAFPLYARRTNLKRFMAHYELFRQTIDLPGDIVELGVFRGHSLLSWANFLEVRNIGDRNKKVWGFDNFAGFAALEPQDGPEYSHVEKHTGGLNAQDTLARLQDAIAIFDQDRFIPWKPRIELVLGDVCETVPRFVEQNPGLRISLLHFDVDLYAPTKVGLECLFPRVVKGGVVIFDEYALLEWGGESQAVEEYLAGQGYALRKFEWCNQPGAYLIK